MSDKELWDAISVIARHMGLLERGQRVEVVGDPRDEPEGVPTAGLCRRVGEHRGVRLLCNYARGHRDAAGTVVHSWQNALVGLSPCTNSQGPSANAPLCELPTHHAGEHEATGADGVRWTWGDAPTFENMPSMAETVRILQASEPLSAHERGIIARKMAGRSGPDPTELRA
jgi:hypothetical protein